MNAYHEGLEHYGGSYTSQEASVINQRHHPFSTESRWRISSPEST